MARYALLIIEHNSEKNLDDECKALAEILKDSNTTLQESEVHGVGSFLFDLKTSLLPFCKITSSAHKLGHPVRVLFLDDTSSFVLQETIDQRGNEAIQRAAKEYFDDLDADNN